MQGSSRPLWVCYLVLPRPCLWGCSSMGRARTASCICAWSRHREYDRGQLDRLLCGVGHPYPHLVVPRCQGHRVTPERPDQSSGVVVTCHPRCEGFRPQCMDVSVYQDGRLPVPSGGAYPGSEERHLDPCSGDVSGQPKEHVLRGLPLNGDRHVTSL